jgi:hypothetical protein
MSAAEKCLEMDRRMVERVEASAAGSGKASDPDDFLDPALWEHYVEARRELVDFTTSSVRSLARSRSHETGTERPAREDSDIERRLMSSLTEMADLEERLASYLTKNLEVLRRTVTDLTRNQVLFSKYAKTGARPEPDHLSSLA